MTRLREEYQLKVVLVSDIMPTTNAPSKELKQSLFDDNDEFDLIEEPRIKRIEHKRYKYKKISGGRRIESARQAGIEKIRCIIIDVDDIQHHWIGLITNSGTTNYAEEAEHIYSLCSEGFSQTEIAKRTGYSAATISTRIKLKEKLIPQLFEMLRKGELTGEQAKNCTKLTRIQQEELLQDKITTKAISEKYRESQSSYFLNFEEEEIEVENTSGLFITPDNLDRIIQGSSVVVKLHNGTSLEIRGEAV